MRGCFKLSLLIVSTGFVYPAFADDSSGFYQELRRQKAKSPAEIESIKQETAVKKRIEEMNRISAEGHENMKKDAAEHKQEKDTGDSLENENEYQIPKTTSVKPSTPATRTSTSTSEVAPPKVDTSNIPDHLEFPGE